MVFKLLSTALFYFLFLINQMPAPSYLQSEIETFLRTEESCWNRGDLPSYVELYLPDDSTRIITKTGVILGKKNILTYYKKYWPTPETMGRLKLSCDFIEKISNHMLYHTGFFQLTSPDGKMVKGRFSSIMKKVKGRWYIYTDHSS